MKHPLLLLLPILAFTAACSTGGATDATRYIRGSIETILPTPQLTDVKAFVRIKGEERDSTKYAEADMSVTINTKIFRLEGEQRVQLPFDSLKTGQRVEATFAGAVTGSVPVSGMADEIVILGR